MRAADTRLTNRTEIDQALKNGSPVFADCMNLPERLRVKAAKVSHGILHVQLLEGWRVPALVYISEYDGRPASQTATAGSNGER